MTSRGIPTTAADIPTGLKCVKVYIPTGSDVHLYAFRGALTNLAQAWYWDTGGDYETALQIAAGWMAASEATDLTDLCDDCTEIEDMNLNVNVNCCCNGSGDNLVCYDKNGQPIVAPQPYTPDDGYVPPTGGDWPMDPINDPPPASFDDWDAYDTNACAAANAVYELMVFIMAAIHGVVDLAVSAAAALIALAALFPAQLAEALASGFVGRMAEALVKLASHSEDAKDWIEDIQAYLAANQENIVCTLYTNRHNIPAMKVNFINQVIDYLVSVITLDAGDLVVLREFLERTVPLDVMMSWYTNAAEWTLLTVTPIDCTGCLPGDAFTYLEPFTTDIGLYGPASGGRGWRSDNGGEFYTIGHVADIFTGLARTEMLPKMGQAHLDVEAWYCDRLELTIRRNIAQAVDTDIFCTFQYRDGTTATVVKSGSTTDANQVFTFANPYPSKPLWDSQAAAVDGLLIGFPGVPGASTWFEYFITQADFYGSYDLGTYVDYGDTRP